MGPRSGSVYSNPGAVYSHSKYNVLFEDGMLVSNMHARVGMAVVPGIPTLHSNLNPAGGPDKARRVLCQVRRPRISGSPPY